MRINKFVALGTGMSRRAADTAIEQGRVSINGQPPTPGQQISDDDSVTLDSLPITTTVKTQTIILNKPAGYVVSRDGQGSKTIYDLLPEEFHNLKPVGRLDKDSLGLLLLTNDGNLAHELTHPSFQKEKVYEVTLDRELTDESRKKIENGIMLEDGTSALKLAGQGKDWTVTMSEGRNRQIRRTFASLDYKVTKLRRTKFGNYILPPTLQQNGYVLVSE